MKLTGKQKAALLLTCLDTSTAASLLKEMGAETVQDLAVELAYLNANGMESSSMKLELTNQFCNDLRNSAGPDMNNFLDKVLKDSLGEAQAENMQQKIQHQLQRRDPFMSLRAAPVEYIVKALESEHPQAIAVVLSELPPKKSSEMLNLLDEGVRISAVARMTSCGSVTVEAKVKIAQLIESRINKLSQGSSTGEGAAASDESLRKTAIILRNLSTDIRNELLGKIKEKDVDAGESISNLMIIWSDITVIKDRSLQNALREVDMQQLALALVEADGAIIDKIKSNISERAAETLDEEMGLLADPKKEDVAQAKESVLEILRQLNEKGELGFVEED